jgi:hypothetical protein
MLQRSISNSVAVSKGQCAGVAKVSRTDVAHFRAYDPLPITNASPVPTGFSQPGRCVSLGFRRAAAAVRYEPFYTGGRQDAPTLLDLAT